MSSTVDGNGDLIITYTDVTSINVGHVVGSQGQSGPQGGPGDTGDTGPTGTYPARGNFLTVDSIYGDDTQAGITPSTTSFKTINGAITHRSLLPITPQQTIFVYPGTYYESIVIPKNTAIRGSSTQTTTISLSGPTGPTTLVTMGQQTRIEDLTMTLSSNSNLGQLVGILFPDNTTTSAKVRTCVANVIYDGDDLTCPEMYGVLVSDTVTSKNYSPADAIRGASINVSSKKSGPTGPYGIGVVGTSYFGVRDSNIYCTGPTGSNGPNGIATNNVGCFSTYKQCSIAGSLYDVIQQQILTGVPTIQLAGTDLINATADGNGFTVNMEPSHMFFQLTSKINFGGPGSEIATTQGTYYLHVGSNCSNFSTGVIGYPFVQKVIVFEGLLTTTQGLTGLQVVTVDLYKSSSANVLGTQFAGPLVINATTKDVKFQNKCATFNALTEYLQIRCVISGADLTAGNDVLVGVALY